MEPNPRSIEMLQKHAALLSPEKQAVARYVCDNWPLKARFPKGVAEQARRAYGPRVFDLAGAHSVARELFLEAAKLAHAGIRRQGAKMG
jgi:hypothetical protein